MAQASRILAGLALLALGTSVTACSGSPAITGSPSTVPPGLTSSAKTVTPAVKYPIEFANRTGVTIHLRPNGSRRMNRSISAHSIRPRTSWEPSVDTKGSGSCTFAASIFYVKFFSEFAELFDVQFEKKVHSPWAARYAGNRRNNLIKFCWFEGGGGLASGLAVLQAANRHCSPT